MIGLTRVEDVLTIELQRPERRNALNSQLVEELREAVEKAAGEDVRVIVLTGQGTVFCAGADLSGDAFAADYPDRLIELHKVMDAAPIPVVARDQRPRDRRGSAAGHASAIFGSWRLRRSSSSRPRNTAWHWTTGASTGSRRWSDTAAPGRCC